MLEYNKNYFPFTFNENLMIFYKWNFGVLAAERHRPAFGKDSWRERLAHAPAPHPARAVGSRRRRAPRSGWLLRKRRRLADERWARSRATPPLVDGVSEGDSGELRVLVQGDLHSGPTCPAARQLPSEKRLVFRRRNPLAHADLEEGPPSGLEWMSFNRLPESASQDLRGFFVFPKQPSTLHSTLNTKAPTPKVGGPNFDLKTCKFTRP